MNRASFPDLIADMGRSTRPSGDPTAVRASAQRLAAAADELDRLSGRTGAVVSQARSAWSGVASDTFGATGTRLRTGTATDADTLRLAAGALASYAGRLESAQSAWDTNRERAASEVDFNPAVTPDDLRIFAIRANAASIDAQAAATQLAAELDTLSPTVLDPTATLALGQAAGLAAGIPNPLNLLEEVPANYQDLLKYGLLDPMGIATGFLGVKEGLATSWAFAQFGAASASYRETVLALFAREGAGPSPAAFRIRQTWLDGLGNWMSADRAALAASIVERAHREGDPGLLVRDANGIGELAAGMRGVRAVGEVLGPVGILFDLQTLVGPSNYDGLREATDRSVAGLSMAASSAYWCSLAPRSLRLSPSRPQW